MTDEIREWTQDLVQIAQGIVELSWTSQAVGTEAQPVINLYNRRLSITSFT